VESSHWEQNSPSKICTKKPEEQIFNGKILKMEEKSETVD
jgi:hypothetical protein